MVSSGLWLRTGTSAAVRIPLLGQTSGGGSGSPGLVYDWSDSNTPMAAAASADPYRYLPSGSNLVPLGSTGANFKARVQNTLNAAGTRSAVRLPGGSTVGQPIVYHLTSFDLIGSSGDPNYAFGFWFGNSLQGFYSLEPGGAVIQMDANSMTSDQIDRLAGRTPKPGTSTYLTKAAFQASQMGLCRVDGTGLWFYNIGFQAADQNPLDAVASDLSDLTVPQSAPHQGVVVYPGASGVFDRCWARGAGKAMNSQPPFEHANWSVAKSNIKFYNCESDGRRDASIDSNRPRACSTWMLNNETASELTDCWGHHSNVSRYAANDQNVSTTALSTSYKTTRTKLEQLTNTKNDGRGGYTNVSLHGWESSNAAITITDPICVNDNPFIDGQTPQFFQLTVPGGGAGNPQGGRFRLIRGTFRDNVYPVLNGWARFRIPTSSYWWSDGVATTLYVEGDNGQAKTAWVYNGTWTNDAISAAISSAGVSSTTHYLVRNS